jgi:hypothetical protein
MRRGILGNLAPGTVGPTVELPSDYKIEVLRRDQIH